VPRAKRKAATRVARTRLRAPADPIELVLYVSASSRYALAARRNCAAVLSSFDKSRLRFEVCDISREPERAEEDAVCYTPMLVKRRPLPRTCVLGDLSNSEALVTLLRTCGLEPKR
jgi:hypothetical protein